MHTQNEGWKEVAEALPEGDGEYEVSTSSGAVRRAHYEDGRWRVAEPIVPHEMVTRWRPAA